MAFAGCNVGLFFISRYSNLLVDCQVVSCDCLFHPFFYGCSGDEGLMIKTASSPYAVTGERSKQWRKIKPEYGDDRTSLIDCAIIAGYRGSGSRLDEARYPFSRFLVAVPSSDTREDPHTGELVPMQMFTFARVGTGYKYDELEELNQKLKDMWQPVSASLMSNPGATAAAGGPVVFSKRTPLLLMQQLLMEKILTSCNVCLCVQINKLQKPLRFPSYFGPNWTPKADDVPDVVVKESWLHRAVIVEMKGEADVDGINRRSSWR